MPSLMHQSFKDLTIISVQLFQCSISQHCFQAPSLLWPNWTSQLANMAFMFWSWWCHLVALPHPLIQDFGCAQLASSLPLPRTKCWAPHSRPCGKQSQVMTTPGLEKYFLFSPLSYRPMCSPFPGICLQVSCKCLTFSISYAELIISSPYSCSSPNVILKESHCHPFILQGRILGVTHDPPFSSSHF